MLGQIKWLLSRLSTQSIMSESIISQECQQQRHELCTIQFPFRGGPQTTNCQCPCHSGTVGTFVGESRTVEDKKVI
jgi:hypothetical protein